jgi:hypothetical protein
MVRIRCRIGRVVARMVVDRMQHRIVCLLRIHFVRIGGEMKQTQREIDAEARRQEIKKMIEAGITDGEIMDTLHVCPSLIDKVKGYYGIKRQRDLWRITTALKAVKRMIDVPNESDAVIAKRCGMNLKQTQYIRQSAVDVGLIERRRPGPHNDDMQTGDDA